MKDSERIFLVDPNAGDRSWVARMVTASGRDVHEFSSGAEYLVALAKERPSFSIIEYQLPDGNGADVFHRARATCWRPAAMILTSLADVEIAVNSLKSGLLDYVLKPATNERLMAAVEAGLKADRAARMREDSHRDRSTRLASLNDVERRVMRRLLKGAAATTIAREMNVSLRSVFYRRAKLLGKLGVRSVPELVEFDLLHRLDGAADGAP